MEQFSNQTYINLETFRKSGVGVKTPVWFVQEDGILYVRTIAGSPKVRRIRNNGTVNVAPCTSNGSLLGEWVPAISREVLDPVVDQKVERLLDKKYGLMKKLFSLVYTLQGKKNTVLEIKL